MHAAGLQVANPKPAVMEKSTVNADRFSWSTSDGGLADPHRRVAHDTRPMRALLDGMRSGCAISVGKPTRAESPEAS